MQALSDFIRHANYQPVFNAGGAFLGLAICLIVIIVLLHTLHALGQRTPLYQKHRPVEGWNKRFYPASILMIIVLLAGMWLLNAWSHRIATP